MEATKVKKRSGAPSDPILALRHNFRFVNGYSYFGIIEKEESGKGTQESVLQFNMKTKDFKTYSMMGHSFNTQQLIEAGPHCLDFLFLNSHEEYRKGKIARRLAFAEVMGVEKNSAPNGIILHLTSGASYQFQTMTVQDSEILLLLYQEMARNHLKSLASEEVSVEQMKEDFLFYGIGEKKGKISWAKRWLLLLPNRLCIYKSYEEGIEPSGVPVNCISVGDLKVHPSKKHLNLTTNHRTFDLRFGNEETCLMWAQSLANEISMVGVTTPETIAWLLQESDLRMAAKEKEKSAVDTVVPLAIVDAEESAEKKDDEDEDSDQEWPLKKDEGIFKTKENEKEQEISVNIIKEEKEQEAVEVNIVKSKEEKPELPPPRKQKPPSPVIRPSSPVPGRLIVRIEFPESDSKKTFDISRLLSQSSMDISHSDLTLEHIKSLVLDKQGIVEKDDFQCRIVTDKGRIMVDADSKLSDIIDGMATDVPTFVCLNKKEPLFVKISHVEGQARKTIPVNKLSGKPIVEVVQDLCKKFDIPEDIAGEFVLKIDHAGRLVNMVGSDILSYDLGRGDLLILERPQTRLRSMRERQVIRSEAEKKEKKEKEKKEKKPKKPKKEKGGPKVEKINFNDVTPAAPKLKTVSRATGAAGRRPPATRARPAGAKGKKRPPTRRKKEDKKKVEIKKEEVVKEEKVPEKKTEEGPSHPGIIGMQAVLGEMKGKDSMRMTDEKKEVKKIPSKPIPVRIPKKEEKKEEEKKEEEKEEEKKEEKKIPSKPIPVRIPEKKEEKKIPSKPIPEVIPNLKQPRVISTKPLPSVPQKKPGKALPSTPKKDLPSLPPPRKKERKLID